MLNHPLNVFKHASTWIWLLLIFGFPHMLKVVWYQSTYILEWVMLSTSTPISMTVMADPTGMMFSAVVLFISANVLSFSTIYMQDEKFKSRFTIIVLLFILSMNLLIFIPHFMVLLLGWDGLGIVSFILVIYYQNPKSLAAGMITALTNRIGDVLLLVSIAWTLNQGHWLIVNMWDSPFSHLQIICIMLAAMTKSAQMPFSSWLPAAMAAPTPVSALVHSSTLVTAGVFLLIRFYPFLHSFSYFNTFLLMVAVVTMFMAGLSATAECDAKKIIALSTLSQLGMMMTSLGFNLPHLAFFHMLTHALFKALLFVCAGSFIGCHLHTQDLRWMGNITNQMPVATSCVTLANLALCGFPFMAGFYSKDMIMEAALNSPNNIIMLSLAMFSLGLTSFYSIRFSLSTMWGPTLISPWTSLKEEKNIIVPMLLLSTMSITCGSLMSWFPPISSSFYMVPSYLKFMPLIMVILGVLSAFYISTNSRQSSSMLINWNISHYALCTMWFLVPISSQMMLKWPLMMAHLNMKYIDQGWIENISGLNTNNNLLKLNNYISAISPKNPSAYLISFITAMSMIMIIYF
uniref:NADH-ubiquinone oxidoreductase chain 5 n=1 Tax=Enchytraeus cf. crypticus SL-2017 TaxID=2052677 RepID=A0A286KAW9_9ANNE|nr:NADH dehydrogenase subunit 5 [Enchytraeus cf. crypticus SL-2017]